MKPPKPPPVVVLLKSVVSSLVVASASAYLSGKALINIVGIGFSSSFSTRFSMSLIVSFGATMTRLLVRSSDEAVTWPL